MIKEFLEIGEIVGTHGVRGEMRVNPWCDSPDYMAKFKTLYFAGNESCAVQVKSARPHGNIVLLRLDGVETVADENGRYCYCPVTHKITLGEIGKETGRTLSH